MEVNAGNYGERHGGKASFKFNSTNDGVLLNLHHTVRNTADGTVLRIRFTAAGFSANNERLIAADHRDNIFVFDLVGQRFWTVSERLGRITIIEGLAGPHLVAFGSKEGMVFIVDTDANNCVRKLNAHPGRIVQLTSSPLVGVVPSANAPVDAMERFERRYLLAASPDSAKLYSLDDFSELSRISYGLASHNSFRPNDWHWLSSSSSASNPGSSLISHSTSGIIRVYRINFKLAKELNVTRLIELHLKNTPAQTITFERPARSSGSTLEHDGAELTVKRLTEGTAMPGRRITTAQPTGDGQYYAVLYGHSTVAFLALDSWLICRVVALSNLFITHFAFVPFDRSSDIGAGRVRWPATVACALTVRSADNDLMLLKFGCNGSNPPFLQPLTNRAEHNCYKFRVAPNGRMLANVLSSGEVLLHNLLDLVQADGFDALATGRKEHSKRSRTLYGARGATVRPDSTASRSSSSSSAVPVCGLRNAAATSGVRKVKLDQQISALHVQLSKTLPRDRLLPILKEYGEYPAKYRPTIWRTLLELPGDAESYGRLLHRGHHPCVASYGQRFAGYEQRTVRNLKKTVSCLAHWCPVFGLIDYMPSFVLPFARQQPNDALGLFETVATVLVNQCQLWFEFAPLDPFNYLALVENVLAECEPRLMAFYREHNVASRTYVLPLMETAFARCCSDDQWLTLWDHVLSNEPYFLVFLIAAYSSIHRGTLMAANGAAAVDTFFFPQSGTLDVRRLVRRAHELMERCSDKNHPRNYFKSFVRLSNATGGGALALRTHHDQWHRPTANGKSRVFHSAPNNAIDFTSLSSNSSTDRTPSVASADALPNASEQGSSTYVSFCNFPQKLTEVRCRETDALHQEQRRLEAKIIELEKLEHNLQDRMVNNLIRQEHAQRVKEVERSLEEAIAREEQRVEMQRKLLLLHRKQLRERENELSLDVHNAKLISDATVRERELDALLKKFEREREETDLLFAEEDIKLKELELLARYSSGVGQAAVPRETTSDERPLDQRYQVALEQLAVQKLKLYDEIDRTYSSLGMPSGVNEYTYHRTVSELRKVASDASCDRYPARKEPARHSEPAERHPVLVMDGNSTSQVTRPHILVWEKL
uniref:Rab-GAP TBC domain-containing protein n=1 Tax=Anopheles stephensi TaxID=30069 RepID=A0A182YKT7_ANOST